jgi:tetratricopeptide (TPR) repeat protein
MPNEKKAPFRIAYEIGVRLYRVGDYVAAEAKFEAVLKLMNDQLMPDLSYQKAANDYLKLIASKKIKLASQKGTATSSGQELFNVEQLNVLADKYYQQKLFEQSAQAYQKVIDALFKEKASAICKRESAVLGILATAYWNQAMCYQSLDAEHFEPGQNDYLRNARDRVILARDNYPDEHEVSACIDCIATYTSELALREFDEAVYIVKKRKGELSDVARYEQALEHVKRSLAISQENPKPLPSDDTLRSWCQQLQSRLERNLQSACWKSPNELGLQKKQMLRPG